MSREMFVICLTFMFGLISTQHTHNNIAVVVDKDTVFPAQTTCVRSFKDVRRCKRVIGGTPANLGDWPWIAALGYQRSQEYHTIISWRCAGTLITNKHVITAAHCVTDLEGSKLTTARLGELDLDKSVIDGSKTLDFLVKKIISHVDFDKYKITNDIALLILYDTVHFTEYIRPICLPLQSQGWNDINFEGTEMYVAGWGRTSNKKFEPHTTLREVQVPTITIVACRSAYTNKRNVVDTRVICAGAEGKDACQGDSGGPLMYKKNDQYFLVGIVSAGSIECGKLNVPGVYTRITSFTDWIFKQIKES